MQTIAQGEAQPADVAIGERVHQLLWRSKTSQNRFAPTIGMTQAALSRKIRGERPWYADELIAIARHFDVSVGSLFGESGGPAKDPQLAKGLPSD